MNDLLKEWIAEGIRRKAENYVVNLPEEHYEEIKPDTLQGLCAITSKALEGEMRKHGFDAQMYRGMFLDGKGSHCWVECDGKIYDVTATQFGVEEPVLITDNTDERYLMGLPVTNLIGFRTWPAPQKPSKVNISRLLRSYL